MYIESLTGDMHKALSFRDIGKLHYSTIRILSQIKKEVVEQLELSGVHVDEEIEYEIDKLAEHAFAIVQDPPRVVARDSSCAIEHEDKTLRIDLKTDHYPKIMGFAEFGQVPFIGESPLRPFRIVIQNVNFHTPHYKSEVPSERHQV